MSPGADFRVERDGDVVFFAEGDDAVDEAGEFGGAACGDVALHGGGERRGGGVHDAQALLDEVFFEGEAHGRAEGLDLFNESDESVAGAAARMSAARRMRSVSAAFARRRSSCPRRNPKKTRRILPDCAMMPGASRRAQM